MTQQISQKISVESLIKRKPARHSFVKATSEQIQIESVEDLIVSGVRSLSRPYNPLLSYFRNEQGSLTPTGRGIGSSLESNISLNQPEAFIYSTVASAPQVPTNRAQTVTVDSDAFARTPAKAKPCGSCPALKGDLCRCALKRAGHKAA